MRGLWAPPRMRRICCTAITATEIPFARQSLQVAAYSTALLVASPRRKHMEQAVTTPNGSRRNEDIALDLLKVVAASAGVGRGTATAAGFVVAPRYKTAGQEK